ncbi:hypothetical protein B0T18DRAFT_427818 [Schizothecium vesticola]|uniref:Uncharacterized protein n=1 Tax=Schizothecium vesticola TaxID=314040 RepID=A0AA40K8C0_9PEZI|nr:hypothetical protein B0T18DRAFT_427818 [Schizothecium vesticola]
MDFALDGPGEAPAAAEWEKHRAVIEEIYLVDNFTVVAMIDASECRFLAPSMFPLISLFCPELVRAHEIPVSAMTDYIRAGSHRQASGILHKRIEQHCALWR